MVYLSTNDIVVRIETENMIQHSKVTRIPNSSRRDDTESDQNQLPMTERLKSIKKKIEKVDGVLNDISELQLKGKNLQDNSNDEKAYSDTEQSVNTDLEDPDKSHSKLDVEELIEIDRGLQYVQWMQLIQDISQKVRLIV